LKSLKLYSFFRECNHLEQQNFHLLPEQYPINEAAATCGIKQHSKYTNKHCSSSEYDDNVQSLFFSPSHQISESVQVHIDKSPRIVSGINEDVADVHSYTPGGKRKCNGYSHLQLYSSGFNRENPAKIPLVSERITNEKDSGQRNKFNRLDSSNSMFVSTGSNDDLSFYSYAEDPVLIQNENNQIHTRSPIMKPTKSWRSRLQTEQVKLHSKEQKTKQRRSMPLHREFLQKFVAKRDGQISLTKYNTLIQRWSADFEDVNKPKDKLMYNSEFSCSDSELVEELYTTKRSQNHIAGYPQRKLPSHSRAKSQKPSTSSFGTASVSSIEFMLEKNHLQNDSFQNVVRNFQQHTDQKPGSKRGNKDVTVNSADNNDARNADFSSTKPLSIGSQKQESYFDLIK